MAVIHNQYSMRILLFTVFFISLLNAHAQVIKGKITSSKNGEALPGVAIVADGKTGVTSDSIGNYQLDLLPGTHNLMVRLITFRQTEKTVVVNENESIVLNFSLEQDARDLGIVVISAGKFEQRLEDVTVSMEVLKPALIENRNSITMEEAVDYIPGVNIVDGQANIRGGSGWSYGAGSRVQILVDDLPQLTADASDAKWNFLPVENVEQVEVIKGASSVLFGSSALNGVINVRTAYPRDTPLTKVNMFSGFYDKAFITTDRKYSLSYQNDPSFFSGLNFSHSRKIKQLDLVIGGNAFKDNGYREGENEKRIRFNFNTRYNFGLKGLSAGINFNTMITNASIFFLWKNDTSGAYIPALNTLSESKTYRTNIDPYITYTGRNGASHRLRLRWFNTTNKNNTNQDSRGDLYYSEYQFQKKFKNEITLTTGVVSIFSVVRSQLYNDHDGSQYAAYLQGDYKIHRITLSAGMRVEESKVDTITDTWTPVFRSGVNYHVFGETYLRASIGQAYRFPSIAERFVKTSISGVFIFPNPELKPEKGLSVEAGLKQGFQIGDWKGFVDAAVFQNNYSNMMEFAFAQWGDITNLLQSFGFKSVNVGKTRIKGIEFSITGEGPLLGEIRIATQAGYTYLDPRQITYDSLYITKIGKGNVKGSDSTDFLKYRSRHMIKGDLEVSRKKAAIGFSLRYTSRMENIDKIFNEGLLDAAFPPGLGIGDYRKYHKGGDLVVDCRVSYDVVKSIRLSFLVKNIFNHIYMQRPADMQPPRTFTLQVSAKF